MKVLLRENVDGVGARGDVVEVADGYGRNYLVPRGFAMPASKGAERQAVQMRRARDTQSARDHDSAQEVATILAGKVVSIAHKAGEGGRLFGSVTPADIVEAVGSAYDVDIDRKAVLVDEPIRSLGSHEVAVRLHAEVEFPLMVEVTEA